MQYGVGGCFFFEHIYTKEVILLFQLIFEDNQRNFRQIKIAFHEHFKGSAKLKG